MNLLSSIAIVITVVDMSRADTATIMVAVTETHKTLMLQSQDYNLKPI